MLKKAFKTLGIFILISLWFLSGWPPVWQNPRIPPKIQEARAAVAYQTVSTIADSTGADVTVTLPAHQAGDVFLLQVVVRDTDDTITVTDWTQITTVTDGTAAKHWWFWKRATSASETNPLVDKSTATGDTYASVTSYRGAVPSGDPWEATSTAVCTGTADPFTLTGVTTLTDSSLVVASWNDIDNFFASATYTPTNPSSLTSNMVNQSAVGADGSNCSGSAVRTTAGATGNVSVDPNKAPDGACGLVLALKPNISPSLNVDEPDGTSDAVTAGQSYNIQYDLSDSDDVVTAAFYYDADTDMTGGTAITGPCAATGEGTNVTCSWDTTGVTAGSYYVYGVTSDGVNPEVKDLSPGQITINAAVVSVSVSDGIVTYGTMPANTAKTTLSGELNDMQTATNDGDVTENFNIKGQDATGGGCTWTLASTNGSDQYIHQFCNATDNSCTSPPTNYAALTTTYQTLKNGVAVSGTVNFHLRLTTPNPSSCFGQQSADITIQAVQ